MDRSPRLSAAAPRFISSASVSSKSVCTQLSHSIRQTQVVHPIKYEDNTVKHLPVVNSGKQQKQCVYNNYLSCTASFCMIASDNVVR